MKNIWSVWIIIIAILSVLLTSCLHKSDKKTAIDDFYMQKGEWDSARLPLIKPYEAIITSKEFGWIINLEGVDGDTGIPNVKKIAVKNGGIFLYNTNSILHGIDTKQLWYVIIPGKHIEKGFSTYPEYSKYLKEKQIKEPKLFDIEVVAEYFDNHDVINWNDIEVKSWH